MNAAKAKRGGHRCPPWCHSCPDVENEVMPGCSGAALSYDMDDCYCEIAPRYLTTTAHVTVKLTQRQFEELWRRAQQLGGLPPAEAMEREASILLGRALTPARAPLRPKTPERGLGWVCRGKPMSTEPEAWKLCERCGHPRVVHRDDVCRVAINEEPSCLDCAARLRLAAGFVRGNETK